MDIIEPSTIHQRLSTLIDYLCKGNKTAFGRETDILPGVLASITGGRLSKPSFELLQKIMIRYPSVSGDWLLLGRGPMLLQEEIKSDSDSVLHARSRDENSVHSEQTKEILDLVKRTVTEQIAQNQLNVELHFKQLNEELARIRAEDILGLEEEAEEVINRINGLANNEKIPDLYELDNRLESIERAVFILKNTQVRPLEVTSVLTYRLGGRADYAKPFEGLLHKRLGISQEEARHLVLNGGINYIEIEGMGKEFSEHSVRKYLNQKKLA